MRIERPELDAALLAFVSGGHGLVVGRPGAGKTHSLDQLTRGLDVLGTSYLFVAVDELGEATEDDLRLALGYETSSIADQLQRLYTAAPEGVLIVDGFDAARSATARARLLALIRSAVRRAPSGWSVIVSVRNYDAAKSPALLELFRTRAAGGKAGADPGAGYSIAGVSARHFAIPELTDSEVAAAIAQIPIFEQLYPTVSEGLKRLAHIPFNLWLLERIVRAADPGRVSALESEVQLLGLYWETQVTTASDAEQRTLVLRRSAERMVGERRLSADKLEIYSSDVAVAWQALLSAEILVETTSAPERVQFRHNILFDYAVSRLLITDTEPDLIKFLTADPSRPLFLRPSVVYYFARLWYANRTAFWSTYWHLLNLDDVSVRLVGRLIPPVIIAEETRESRDLDPLVRCLHDTQSVGAVAVLRTLQALRFVTPRDAKPWLTFAVRAAHALDRTFAWELGAFVGRTAESADAGVDAESLREIGYAARLFFEWAWLRRSPGSGGTTDASAEAWYDAFASIQALPLVLRTFGTDVQTNTTIVRRVLGLLRETDFPIRYFDVLANNVGSIASLAPGLVAEIYRAIFGHDERSATKTHMGGIVLPLTSTRRQDFSMCHYALAKAYPDYLRVAPDHAIPVAIYVLNQVAVEKHVRPYLREGATLDDLTERFAFLGVDRPYMRDFSAAWSLGLRDEAGDMIEALVGFLTNEGTSVDPARVIKLMADTAVVAASWAAILEVGAGAPGRYASLLFEVALARPVQLGSDTLRQLGTFIERAVQQWMPEQRQRFEESILALAVEEEPDEAEEIDERHAGRVRDLLLARIPGHLLIEPAARARVDKLLARGALPGNEAPFVSSTWAEAYTNDDWLAEQGVETHATANLPLRQLANEMEQFSESWRNDTPDPSAVAAMVPALVQGLNLLLSTDVDGRRPSSADTNPTRDSVDDNGLATHGRRVQRSASVGLQDAQAADQVLVEYAWTKLAAGARAVAQSKPGHGSEVYTIARRVLLGAAARPAPPVEKDADVTYTTAYWSPTARTEAIQGLAILASVAPLVDRAPADNIAAFSISPNPQERFLAVQYATYLARTWPAIYWQLAETCAANERNVVVATALLRTLGNGLPLDEQRARILARSVIERWMGDDHLADNADLRQAVADWLIYLATFREDWWARTLVDQIIRGLPRQFDLAKQIVFQGIHSVTPEALTDPIVASASQRTLAWLKEMIGDIRRKAAALRQSLPQQSPDNDYSESVRAGGTTESRLGAEDEVQAPAVMQRDRQIAQLHELVDTVVAQIYFNGRRVAQASERAAPSTSANNETTDNVRLAYHRAVEPLLRAIVGFAGADGAGVMVARTAHHLMELLNDVLDLDPLGALSMAAAVANAAAGAGYQFDSLAVQEVVRLVETVLADYRQLITDGKPLADILSLLDVFANAGWPDALRLVWRLDEVFR